MSAVTYGDSYVAAGAAAGTPKKSWFARALDHIIEARMRQAQAEVRRHLGYLPYSLDQAGDRLVKARHQDMPFGL